MIPAILISISLFLIPLYSQADILNQRENFFVNPEFDRYKRTKLNATLRHISDNAYFYVEDSYWDSIGSVKTGSILNNILELADDFDNIIYPKETQFWGSEPKPGIDGDPGITILFHELTDNNGGYFDTSNGYALKQVSNSNQREMIVINSSVASDRSEIIKNFLAHEFQHLISFNQKDLKYGDPENTWLNELRSEYSLSVTGYNDTFSGSNLERRLSTFTNNPSDSLTEWPNSIIDYGMAALFGEYLVEQYGPGILRDTLKSSLFGISSLNQYLQSHGYYERFSDIFMNWMGVVYLNDRSQNSKLGYSRSDLASLRVRPHQNIYLSYNFQEYSIIQAIKDWQPVWLEFDVSTVSADQTKSLRIDFDGQPGENYIASSLAFYESGPVELGKINIISGRGSGYASNSGKRLKKVVVMVTKATETSGFKENEPTGYLNIKVSTVDNKIVQANSIKDGVLIKRPNEKEIYVIWGKYKRYLNPGVISLYGHLNPANAIEVEPEIFNSYQTSNYVKYVNEQKVYAVWPDSTKHWMNITPQQWDASSRDWGAIFTINDLEVNYYKTGLDIIR